MILVKKIARQAASLLVMDVVFYKDENNKLYRLISVPVKTYSLYDELKMAACKNKYAPDIIDGDIIEDNPKEILVNVNNIDGNNHNWCIGVYKFEKNAENYEFWDVTDYDEDKSKGKLPNIARGSDFL